MQGLDERTRDLIQRRVLKRVNDIPSLPQFVIETLKKLDDPKSSAADVANKLSRDEGLVIRVLRLANSAYYGLSRRISSVSEAISFLGFKTVKSIVLAASVYKFMDSSFTRLRQCAQFCSSVGYVNSGNPAHPTLNTRPSGALMT